MFGLVFWVCVLAILYTYVGYPVLVTLLARSRPQRVLSIPEPPPSVTLLIAAYNEEQVIEAKLTNSLELDYPRDLLQILVASDGSDDRTPELVATFADRGVELSHVPDRGGKMAAITRGMSLATGDVVVFSDANNLYNEDAILELVKPFASEHVGAVTGAKRIVRDERSLSSSEGAYWRYESFIKEQESRLGCTIGAAGEIFAIRRNLYTPPPSQIINDDFFIASRIIRQGHDVIYNPAATSSEPVSATAEGEVRRRTRIIAGRYQAMFHARQLLPFNRPVVAWQMISHKFLRPFVPFWMIGALMANIGAVVVPARTGGVVTLAAPFHLQFLLLQAGFYGMAMLGNTLETAGRAGKVLYAPTFLVNSNLAALAGLYRALTDRGAHLWERVERGPG